MTISERLAKLEEAIQLRPLLVIFHEESGMSDEQIADIARAKEEGREIKTLCFTISE